MEQTTSPITSEPTSSSASPVPLSAAPQGTFITYGDGPDLDAALDDATSSAWFDLGRAHTTPSVANMSQGSFVVSSDTPVPMDVAVLMAQNLLASGEPISIAIPVSPQSAYKRRRVTVRLEDTSLEVGDVVGRIDQPTEQLVAAIRSAAPDSESELIGWVEIKRNTARYKAIAERFTEPRLTRWGVYLSGSDKPLDIATSQSAARKSAMLMARSGEPNAGVARYEIRPVVTRGELNPFLAIRRERVKLVLVVRAELHASNPAARQRTIGYVIAGRPTS